MIVRKKVFSFLTAIALVLPETSYATIIKSIKIDGLRRIEKEVVWRSMSLRPQQATTPDQLNSAVKDLFKTRYFSQVDLNLLDDGVLHIKVEESPIISEVNFIGIPDKMGEALRNELYSRPRGVYNKERLKEDSEKIRSAFFRHGRINFNIITKVQNLADNKVNVIFEIIEGEESKIDRVIFIGNKSFKDTILSANMAGTGVDKYFAFIKGKTFDEEMFEKDKLAIKTFYQNKGFPDANVKYSLAEYDRSTHNFSLTFSIEEGEKYKIGYIEVDSSLSDIDSKTLFKKLKKVKKGQLYSKYNITLARLYLTAYLGEKGYLGIKVDVNEDIDTHNGVVNLTYNVHQGEKKYINRVNILGTTRTNDYVVRRELLFSEGDMYQQHVFHKSQRQLQMLGYFDSVNITTSPVPNSNKVDVNVEVKDRAQTGSVNFSVGYSTIEQIMLNAGISKTNLLGKGYQGSFNVMASAVNRNITASFMNPHFLGSNVGLGVSAQFSNFQVLPIFGTNAYLQALAPWRSNDFLFSIQTGYPIMRNLYHTISLQLRYNQSASLIGGTGVDTLAARMSYSEVYRSQITNSFLTTSVRNSFQLDLRNNPILPTKGLLINAGQEVSLPLPSIEGIRTPKYFSGDIFASLYIPLHIGGTVLNIAARAGAISDYDDSSVPFQLRYSLGYTNFRGFFFNSVGPKVQVTAYQDGEEVQSYVMPYTIRANYFYVTTAEFLIPLPFLPRDYNVRLLAFVDVGSAFGFNSNNVRNQPSCGGTDPDPNNPGWCYDLTVTDPEAGRPTQYKIKETIIENTPIPRVSVGFGALWISPFGPIRLEAAFAVFKQTNDALAQFRIHFSPTPI